MRTEWCPDCGQVFNPYGGHVCAPRVPTETEEQAKPLPCRTCRHGSVFLGVVACNEGTTATEVDGLLFADTEPSPGVVLWFLGPQDGPCPGYVQRDESTDKKDGGDGMGREQWFSFSEDTGFQRHGSAEGEAAGAARERAAVVAWLRETVWAADEADYIERGEHVGAAGGAA